VPCFFADDIIEIELKLISLKYHLDVLDVLHHGLLEKDNDSDVKLSIE